MRRRYGKRKFSRGRPGRRSFRGRRRNTRRRGMRAPRPGKIGYRL